jgi:hypothetical protein
VTPNRSPTTVRFRAGRRVLRATILAWARAISPNLVVRIVAHWLLAFSLLSTFLLIAVDHHGAERIATHRHLAFEAGLPAAHLHGFELTHRHDGQLVPVQASGLLMTASDASAQGVLLLAFGACLMIVFWLLAWSAATWQIVPRRLSTQLVRRPPVPPPTW